MNDWRVRKYATLNTYYLLLVWYFSRVSDREIVVLMRKGKELPLRFRHNFLNVIPVFVNRVGIKHTLHFQPSFILETYATLYYLHLWYENAFMPYIILLTKLRSELEYSRNSFLCQTFALRFQIQFSIFFTFEG